MVRSLKVAVAGGGIGGLTVAVALAHHGHHVTVFEQAPALGEVGAGLQLSANGMRVFEALDLARPLRDVAFEPLHQELCRAEDGTLIFQAPLGKAAARRYGAPYLHVHRADLVGVLRSGARDAGVDVKLGHTILHHACEAQCVRVHFRSGQCKVEAEVFDLLVGADGLRSGIRQRIVENITPRFTGQIAWRGLVPTSRLPKDLIPPIVRVWAGPGRHFVHYFVRRGELLNFVAVEEQAEWTEENWSLAGDVDRLRHSFSGWHGTVGAILAEVEDCFVWGLFDHPVLPHWSREHAVLLGDACHPMLPFMAQGAVMAIEDAFVLARVVTNSERTMPQSLALYEHIRKPRATRVQAVARRNARLFHLRGDLERRSVFGAIGLGTRLFPSLMAAQHDWLYGYDVTETER